MVRALDVLFWLCSESRGFRMIVDESRVQAGFMSFSDLICSCLTSGVCCESAAAEKSLG